MRRLNRTLNDATVARQLDQLELSGIQIMDRVIDDRRNLGQVKQFMTRYLPLSIRLMNQCVQGEDAGHARAVLDAMVSAFHRQLNSLYRNETLDIAADLAHTQEQLKQAGVNEQ